MTQLDLSDPGWFPVDYLLHIDQFRVMLLDVDAIGDSSFLDRRLQVNDAEEVFIDAEGLRVTAPAYPPAFVFHTAFCGSTLLARALHAPPLHVSLKEPSVLLSLSSASLAETTAIDTQRIDHRLDSAIALLARSWTPGGRVLIKPTNQANRLIERILQNQPASRAILLSSSLEEFVVSCFKKLPVAETRIRWMAQHLLAGSELAARLGIPANYNFSLPESCVFTWYAQMERFARVLDGDGGDRLRTLDLQTMLAAPVACVTAAAAWLDLQSPPQALAERVAGVFQRDSKTPQRAYSHGQRELEKAAVQVRFGEVIGRTLEWARTSIEPHARLPMHGKALRL